ncbi:MAG: Fic family protein [Deltaproteobacteria bacterium]|nr:Fic family protein [Deltaproteobacteria bacterium]
MGYEPKFTITPKLLGLVEAIAAVRERIQAAAVEVAWIPALQKDSRARNAHSSTAIEGNPLTLEQVRAVEEQGTLLPMPSKPQREVIGYFAGLRYIEKFATKKAVTHAEVCRLHLLIAGDVMDQGEAGVYRNVEVRVGQYLPPKTREVKGLMTELLDWWNTRSAELSPVLSQGILHYRFEAIHPFADGNGRTGRALAIWELYRRGFDSHHVFSVDEHYWEDRPRYYRELQAVREAGEDLTGFLEYSAEGLHQTLERVWRRVQQFSATTGKTRLVLRPKQEQVLFLLKANGSMTPRQIWDALGVSKQGALDTLKPLIKAGLIKRIGTQKNGRYVLK